MKKIMFSLLGLLGLFIIPLFFGSLFFSNIEVEKKERKKEYTEVKVDQEIPIKDFQGEILLELITNHIAAEKRSQVLYVDSLVWTNYLKSFPAFVKKVVWVDQNNPDQVLFFISWDKASFDHSLTDSKIDSIDHIFHRELKRVGVSAADFEQLSVQQYEMY